MATEKSFSVVLRAAPEAIRPLVVELDRYPEWMRLVHEARPVGDEVWAVELRAKVGPFARSKRLRMRRTYVSADEVIFERDEGEGRRHSPWVLSGRLVPDGDGTTTVTMHLRYGGSLWVPLLDGVLADSVEDGRDGLRRLVESGG